MYVVGPVNFNSTTLTNVSGATFTVAPAVTCNFRLYVVYDTSTDNGLGLALSFSGMLVFARAELPTSTAGGYPEVYQIAGSGTRAQGTSSQATGNVAVVEGVAVGQAGGTCQVQLANELGSRTITLNALALTVWS